VGRGIRGAFRPAKASVLRNAAPVYLGFFMTGKLIEKKLVETKPSGLVYFDPFPKSR